MKLNIGENIKNLRRERNLTQEEFANTLGVTYQSVSRWENGVCYPDTELLPDIAEFFGITVDKLLGADTAAEQKEVDEYLERFQRALNKGLVYDCIDIAREGVAAYPNNYRLLNKLMDALFISGDSDGNIPEWEENQKKNDAEITALGERIIKHCTSQEIRLEATARLAFNHCLMGRKEIGRKIYETLPSMEYCRENQIWWALETEEKESFLRKQIGLNYHYLRSRIWLLGNSGCLPESEEIKVLKKAFELEELITDGNVIKNGWGHARLNYCLASCHAIIGEKEKALEHLKLCAQAAKAFDERPEEWSFESLLLGKVTQKRMDFETSDSRPLRQIIKEDWLNTEEYEEFEQFKNDAEYIGILEELG